METKKFFEIKPAASTDQVFILCRMETPDEDGVVAAKAGFLQVVPEKAESMLNKLRSGERNVLFGGRIGDSTLYEIKVLPKTAANVAAPAAGELNTTTV